jgi:polyisoprenoid-binding protein YceI
LRASLVGAAIIAAPTTSRRRPAFAQEAGAPLRYRVVPDRSEVRYRVREQLAGFSFPNDAVGATRAVEGDVALDARGRIVAGASRFTVDPRQLRSDEARRDSYLRRNTLETDRYPTVAFVPVEVRGLSLPVREDGAGRLQILGDLTVRDATRRVTWEATLTAADGREVGVRASTAFRFGEFGLPIPRVSVVLSVDDTIRLEADLVLRTSS